MAWWKRVIALGGALGLLIPGWQTDAIGLIILIGIHILQVRKAKKEAGTTE